MPKYDERYFNGQHIRDRMWEIEIGKNIVEVLNIKSIIDLGCGVCGYLEGVYREGCDDIVGIDLYRDYAIKFIPKNLRDKIVKDDIANDLNLERTFDCSLSIEVAEHINPKATDIFIDNVTRYSHKYIVFTAAPPGQRGRGHINLRKKKFWIDRIEDKGFKYSDKLVNTFLDYWKKIEILDTEYSTVPVFIYNNLMVFEKR